MCEVQEHQKIIDALGGSSAGLAAHLESHNRSDLENNATFLALLDAQIFNCAECDWWCAQDEAREGDPGEDICNGCAGTEA